MEMSSPRRRSKSPKRKSSKSSKRRSSGSPRRKSIVPLYLASPSKLEHIGIDAQIEVIRRLSLDSIVKLCESNKYFYELCKEGEVNRIIQKKQKEESERGLYLYLGRPNPHIDKRYIVKTLKNNNLFSRTLLFSTKREKGVNSLHYNGEKYIVSSSKAPNGEYLIVNSNYIYLLDDLTPDFKPKPSIMLDKDIYTTNKGAFKIAYKLE